MLSKKIRNKKNSSNKKNSGKKTSKKGKRQNNDIIYFDNNSTTFVCDPAKQALMDWISCYNASSDSKMAKPVKQILEQSGEYLLGKCGVSSATHTAIFTSGATESNCFIIRACAKAYKKKLIEMDSMLKPHIICSALEHHSIMECVHDLENIGEIDVTYVYPTIYGNIKPEDVEKEIKQNTCLITMMFANNEIPVLTNIKKIGEIAHKNRIPLHSDCVQIFGKYEIDIIKNNIDALSASGHKFYAPKGIGLLILSNALIDGYNLTAEISGSQQHGLRGGTENVAAVVSMTAAYKHAHNNRAKKNEKLFQLRSHCLEKLREHFKFNEYENYAYPSNEMKFEDLELISLGPPEDKRGHILPNTLLIAICKNKGRPFCNVELKKYLDIKNIIVSIGSACLTKSEKASHVLSAIAAPPVVKRGVLRISFNDDNTIMQINKFIKLFVNGVFKQCTDLDLSKKEINKIDKLSYKIDDEEQENTD